MAKRKNLSASLRWNVLARDGFSCRYCGAQAGDDSVELVVDHVVSVVEGGTDAIDNLVTACQRCNGGKGAKSLQNAPAPKSVIKRINKRTSNLKQQADAIERSIEAQKELKQKIVNLKCSAYEVESIRMATNEEAIASNLCTEFGADQVYEWYSIAYRRGVRDWSAIKYVCGIARKVREDREADE